MSEFQTCLDETISALTKISLPSMECIKVIINTFLGVGMMAGAPFTKIAQIGKIISKKSTDGLPLSSFLLETLMFYASWGYNRSLELPFTSYGEAAILAVMVFALVLCMFYYGKGGIQLISIQPLYVAAVVATTVSIIQNSIPLTYWRSIYALQVPIVMASRIPQIITLFSEKKTGVLSFIAVFLNFAGTAVRSLTSFMIWQKSNFGTDQAWIFGNFAVCLTLNSIILAQWCYYGEDGNGYLCLRRDAKKAKKKRQ